MKRHVDAISDKASVVNAGAGSGDAVVSVKVNCELGASRNGKSTAIKSQAIFLASSSLC